MKKTVYLSLALLLITFPLRHIDGKVRKHVDRITIDSSVLHLVDGTALINVEGMMHFGKNLLILMNGGTKEQIEALVKRYKLHQPHTRDWSEHNVQGIIPCNNRYYTLRELVEEVARLESKKNSTDPAEYKAVYAPYEVALNEALAIFEVFSEPYLEQVTVGKSYIVKLIERWSYLRNKKETALLEWAQLEIGAEQHELRKNITSFRNLDIFCTDLTIFLADMIQSCPKSYKQYKDRHKR